MNCVDMTFAPDYVTLRGHQVRLAEYLSHCVFHVCAARVPGQQLPSFTSSIVYIRLESLPHRVHSPGLAHHRSSHRGTRPTATDCPVARCAYTVHSDMEGAACTAAVSVNDTS